MAFLGIGVGKGSVLHACMSFQNKLDNVATKVLDKAAPWSPAAAGLDVMAHAGKSMSGAYLDATQGDSTQYKANEQARAQAQRTQFSARLALAV
jgi:hypothetical protein